MHTLITRFGSKSALATALNITPEAVSNAFRRGKVPSTWILKLKQQGLSQVDISVLPLANRAADILSALNPTDEHGADHDTDNRNFHEK